MSTSHGQDSPTGVTVPTKNEAGQFDIESGSIFNLEDRDFSRKGFFLAKNWVGQGHQGTRWRHIGKIKEAGKKISY